MNFATARYFGGSDATPPKVGAPKHGLAPGATLGAADVPVRLSWAASDVDGEVTSYQLQQSTDGGAYEDVDLAGATTTTTLGIGPGHDQRFRARATDDNGNRSAWRYGPRFALDAPRRTPPRSPTREPGRPRHSPAPPAAG